MTAFNSRIPLTPQSQSVQGHEDRSGHSYPPESTLTCQKNSIGATNETAEAHPEAPLEIWSQDEARVGQKGRTGYVWWRAATPRAGGVISATSRPGSGAVCPARDTGVALVLTRLDTAAMNRSSPSCRRLSPPEPMPSC